MNLSQITMALEVCQKHQLPSNEAYQITSIFSRYKMGKKKTKAQRCR